MPPYIRKTLSHFLSYKPRKQTQFSAIFEELVFLDQEHGEARARFVIDPPYEFIFADMNTN